MPVVQAQLSYIAVHAVQAPGIGGDHIHRSGLLPVLTMQAVALGIVAFVVGQFRLDRVAGR